MRRQPSPGSCFEGSGFSVVHSVTASAIPPHAHSCYVIGHYFSGASRCRIGSHRSVEFRPGDTGVLNPDESHEDFATLNERDYLTVNLDKSFVRACGGRELSFSSPKLADPELHRFFRAIRTELIAQNFGRDVMLRSLTAEVAVHLLRRCTPPHLQPAELNLDPSDARSPVSRAMEYLRDNYTEEFRLDKVASAAGLSRYYLERVFKKATGLHLHECMMRLRLDRAKELLRSSDLPIVEVAAELGFADQSHFTNVFRKLAGVTPRAYRLGSR